MRRIAKTREGRHYEPKETQQETVLSRNEKICLILLINEYTIKQTAVFMSYSESYIDALISSLKKKLKVKTRGKAIALALIHKIVTPEMLSFFDKHKDINLLKNTFFID